MDFDNLHQVLRNLYQEMMPLCGDMIGVAKGIAGLGALFYVAYRVWKALANAEPIDVFPLLRPFAIGLCVMFFPTVVLGTINAVMSPVVQGTHAILEGQTLDLQAYQQQKDDLEAEARRREGNAWLVGDKICNFITYWFTVTYNVYQRAVLNLVSFWYHYITFVIISLNFISYIFLLYF